MFSSVGRKQPVEPSDENIAGRFPAALGQAVRRSSSINEALTETRTMARGKSARIAIKAKGRIRFIDPADLIAVQAKGNYVLVLQTSGADILRDSISIIEKKLTLHGFVRIHRSVLVNTAMVEEIRPLPSGDYMLAVRGGRKFKVTRTYKKNLQLLAQLWIGMGNFLGE